MLLRTSPLLFVLLMVAACESKPAADEGPAHYLPTVPENARRVAIDVRRDGYHPARVTAQPGEQLALVFTRTEPNECNRYITVQGTKIHAELPVNEPVVVAVEVPESGELVFACGMNMLRGVVVPAPGEAPPAPAAPHEGH